MKTSKDNLERARKLLNELHKLERALYVNSSYHSSVSIKFETDFKHESPEKIEITCPSHELRIAIIKDIESKISKINEELEKL